MLKEKGCQSVRILKEDLQSRFVTIGKYLVLFLKLCALCTKYLKRVHSQVVFLSPLSGSAQILNTQTYTQKRKQSDKNSEIM